MNLEINILMNLFKDFIQDIIYVIIMKMKMDT